MHNVEVVSVRKFSLQNDCMDCYQICYMWTALNLLR
jgi:hypothetical protein